MTNIQRREQGFTLLELMTVVTIVAIIASIGIPSYRTFLIQNAEQEAVAEMKQMQNQLEKWRAARLTYQGFVPKRGSDVCSTDDSDSCYDTFPGGQFDNVVVYTPKGSTAQNYKYAIFIVDNTSDSSLVVEVAEGEVNTTVGRSWKMVAIPRNPGPADEGYKYFVNSLGLQCKTKDPDAAVSNNDCGDHFTTEQW